MCSSGKIVTRILLRFSISLTNALFSLRIKVATSTGAIPTTTPECSLCDSSSISLSKDKAKEDVSRTVPCP